jgi:hypothetical protein
MEMQRMGRSMGMDISLPQNTYSMSPPTINTHELMQFFKEKKGRRVQLVVVVVPDTGDCYGKELTA